MSSAAGQVITEVAFCYDPLPMKSLWKAVTILTLVVFGAGAAPAIDIPGRCDRGCSFNIQIANVRPYVISVTWYSAGGASGSPVVSGTNKDVTAYMAAGTYTIHAKYLDGNGTQHDAAYYQCGNQIKFSFTNHGSNCAAYNEAFVLVTSN